MFHWNIVQTRNESRYCGIYNKLMIIRRNYQIEAKRRLENRQIDLWSPLKAINQEIEEKMW